MARGWKETHLNADDAYLNRPKSLFAFVYYTESSPILPFLGIPICLSAHSMSFAVNRLTGSPDDKKARENSCVSVFSSPSLASITGECTDRCILASFLISSTLKGTTIT